MVAQVGIQRQRHRLRPVRIQRMVVGAEDGGVLGNLRAALRRGEPARERAALAHRVKREDIGIAVMDVLGRSGEIAVLAVESAAVGVVGHNNNGALVLLPDRKEGNILGRHGELRARAVGKPCFQVGPVAEHASRLGFRVGAQLEGVARVAVFHNRGKVLIAARQVSNRIVAVGGGVPRPFCVNIGICGENMVGSRLFPRGGIRRADGPAREFLTRRGLKAAFPGLGQRHAPARVGAVDENLFMKVLIRVVKGNQPLYPVGRRVGVLRFLRFPDRVQGVLVSLIHKAFGCDLNAAVFRWVPALEILSGMPGWGRRGQQRAVGFPIGDRFRGRGYRAAVRVENDVDGDNTPMRV